MKEETGSKKNVSGFWRRALQGAGIAVFVIFMILEMSIGIKTAETRWNIISILLVPVAGAMGGIAFHIMQPLRKKGRNYKFLALGVSIVFFLLILGIGFYFL